MGVRVHSSSGELLDEFSEPFDGTSWFLLEISEEFCLEDCFFFCKGGPGLHFGIFPP